MEIQQIPIEENASYGGQYCGSKVLTTRGWISLENLEEEDKIAARDGKFYSLLGLYRKNPIDAYRFHYSDGASLVFDINHMHIVQTQQARYSKMKKWKIMSTKELVRQIDTKVRIQYDVPLPFPIQYAGSKKFPLNEFGDIDISDYEKNMPQYLYENIGVRYRVLQKAMYDHGCADSKYNHIYANDIEFSSCIVSIIFSLGGTATVHKNNGRYGRFRNYGIDIMFTLRLDILPREVFYNSIDTSSTHYSRMLCSSPISDNRRWIKSITYEAIRETISLATSSPDGSYITDFFVVTRGNKNKK